MLSHIEKANLISFEYSLKYGEKFIYACILINGGALIATLPLINSLFNKLAPHWTIVVGMIAFALGLIAAVIIFGLSHLAQLNETWKTSYNIGALETKENWKNREKTQEYHNCIDVLNKEADKNQTQFNKKKNLIVILSISSVVLFLLGVVSTSITLL